MDIAKISIYLCQYLLLNRLKQQSENYLEEITLTLEVFWCCDDLSPERCAVGSLR